MVAVGILTFIALRTCLKGTNLDQVEVMEGVSLGDLTGNWLASLAEKLGVRPVQSADRFARKLGGPGALLPKQEPLAAAERQALSTVLTCFYVELHAHEADLSPHERQWCLLLGDLSQDFTQDTPAAGQAYERLQHALTAAFGRQQPLSSLLQPGQEDLEAALTGRFHTACLAWLEAEVQLCGTRPVEAALPQAYPADARRPAAATITCPAALRAWFLAPSGFGFHAVRPGDWLRRLIRRPLVCRPWLQLTFLQLWSNCYLEQLKSSPQAFSQHLIDSLAELKATAPRHAEAFDTAAACAPAAGAEALGGMQEQLAALLGITIEKLDDLASKHATQDGQTADLLTGLLAGQTEQSAAWQALRRELGEVQALLHEEHAPPLDTTSRPPTDAAGADVSLRKLIYRERWLPHLLSREDEMRGLLAFLDSRPPCAIHILVGEAGTGKSRIALELMLRAQQAGWRAGFLQNGSRLDADALLHQWRPTGSTLLIIDYASEQGASLTKALARMTLNESEFAGRLRILLIDRPEALAPLLNEPHVTPPRSNDSLLSAPHPIGHLGQDPNREKVRERLHARLGRTGDACYAAYDEKEDAMLLRPLDAGHWQPFLNAVFTRAGHPEHALPHDWEQDVARATAQGRPLMLLVLGLHYLRHNADAESRAGRDKLLDEVIAAEVEHRWLRVLRKVTDEDAAKAGKLLPVLQRIVGFITLTRGLASKHIPCLQEFLRFPDADKDLLLDSAEWILGVQTDEEGTSRFRPLEPDLLAERFLLRGGYASPAGKWLDSPPLPFACETLLPAALAVDPLGVVATLALVRRDYRASFKPLMELLLQHLKDDFGICDATGGLLPYAQVAHPMTEIWTTSTHVLLMEWYDKVRPGLLLSLLQWSRKSPAAYYAGLIGILRLTSSFFDVKFDGAQRICDSLFVEAFFKIREQNPQWTLQEEEDVLLAEHAVNALWHNHHTSNHKAHGQWEDRLLAIAHRHPGNPRTDYAFALGAFNAAYHHGAMQNWPTMDRWQARLYDIAKNNPTRTDIQHKLVLSTVVAAMHHGLSHNWGEVDKWQQRLLNTASRHPDDPEIQSALALGAANALSNHENRGMADASALEAWTARLLAVAAAYPQHEEIQNSLAQGAANAILLHGRTGDMESLQVWGGRLLAVLRQQPQNAKTQLYFARGATNAIQHYGKAQQWPAMEFWGAHLRVTAARQTGDEFQELLAWAAMSVLNHYGSSGNWRLAPSWITLLLDLGAQHPENAAIHEHIADAAGNAISDHGAAQDWPNLEFWGGHLLTIGKAFAQHPDIQLTVAKGALSAINYYGMARNWGALERWGRQMQAVAGAHDQDARIQYEAVRSAVNAVNDYGEAGDFTRLEHWAAHAVAIARHFPQEQEIQHELAKTALNAILSYHRAGKSKEVVRWQKQLNALAERHAGHIGIRIQLRKAINALARPGNTKQ